MFGLLLILQAWLPMPQPIEQPVSPLYTAHPCKAGWIVALKNEPWHTKTAVDFPNGQAVMRTVADERCWQVRICDSESDATWYAVPRDQWLKLRLGDWWDSRDRR